MARLSVMERSESQAIMSNMHAMLEKRLAVSSLAPCGLAWARPSPSAKRLLHTAHRAWRPSREAVLG